MSSENKTLSEEMTLFESKLRPKFLKEGESLWDLKGRIYKIYLPSIIRSIGYPKDGQSSLLMQLVDADFFKRKMCIEFNTLAMNLDDLIRVLKDKINRDKEKFGEESVKDLEKDLQDALDLKDTFSFKEICYSKKHV
jgi:hypothetical protein